MKLALALAVLVISSHAYAADLKDQALAATQKATHSDLRYTVEKSAEGFCGGEGPSYFVTLTIEKAHRTLDDASGKVGVATKPEVIETYAISELDLRSGHGKMMKSGECLE